jgi:ADP-ribose pyrophosphatase
MNSKRSSLALQDVEIVKREILLKEVFFTAIRLHLRHRLFCGNWSDIFTRDVIERHPAAALLPYDPKLDRVILIEQFRPGAILDSLTPWQLEIPAGLIENNETPLEVAIRETQEEAGCAVTNVKLIYNFFPSPGGSTEYLHIFYGEVDAKEIKGIHGLPNEHEDIRVLNLSADEALLKLHRQEIKNGPAIIALQWLQLHRDELRSPDSR